MSTLTDQQIYLLACKDKLVKRYNFMLLNWDIETWNTHVSHARNTMSPAHRAKALKVYRE